MSTCSFKWHKAAVLIAVLALCCFVFAGTALAGVTVTEPSHVLKADHTYDLTIEGSGFEVDLNTFCSDVPYGHPGFKGLIIDFPWTGTNNYNFESDNLKGADGKQIPVYLTIDGTEYMVPVVPVVEEGEADCDNPASVADRVYLVIERQSLALAGNAKVTGFKVEGLEVLTPRTPSANYNLCVSHTVTNCFAPMCTVLEVVPTVEYLELEIVEDSCLVAGSVVSVRGQVYSTEYPAEGSCEEYAPWVGKNSWPVVICLMERHEETVCGESVYTYEPLVSTDDAVWTMDPCGKNQVCKDASSGEPIPCVATSVDKDGIFNATLELPAAGLNKDIVVFARTIEAADNNEDSCLRHFVTVPEHQVAAESIEDIANAIEEIEGQNAERRHIVLGLYEPACADHAWVASKDVEVEIIAGAPFAIRGPVLPDQIEIANPMNPICCADECRSYEIDVTLIDKYCNVTENVDSCEGYDAHNIKVDLKAYYLENGKQKLAGIFYDDDPCLNEDANQIDHTFIPVGESVANKVYFMPTHPGLINMQYSAIINGANKIWEQCGIEVNYNACMLEVTPLVLGDGCTPMNETWSDSPRDGWPIKVSVHYESDVPLRVEILNPDTYKPFNFKGGPDDFLVTWDTEAYAEDGILEFEAEGRYGHGDYLDHPFGNVPYDNNKSDFFVYPVNACGESFIIKVVDEANNIKDEVEIGPLASATELVRILEPSKWQILSTPKTLAGSGDLLSLFDGKTPYNEALTYKNNKWQQVRPYDELEPLYAYVINTQQNGCQEACPGEYCGENLPIYAKYVFDRVTDPSMTLLPERLLTAGANLVGPSFNESEIMLPFELGQEFLEFSPAVKKYVPCFFYEECCLQGGDCCSCDVPSLGSGEFCGPICPEQLFQFDTLARMTATFCEGCSMIANYGGDSAGDCRNSRGNLAFFSTAALGGSNAQSWLTDPLHFAFNGDGYLAYVNGAQTYTGAAQLELVNIAP